ncbi:hypothetical protein ASPWEDRAFT_29358 [Aspergillus wentii DTO 134E9]|uniref:Vacuolar ATPase assembly protein VMA22 n=1 Tax=Aspergillus wentii DTO 134E9 TaxID=1073089 RepID=A0A1L9RGZ3_ASPWE|nr:uncharacterized protein ASPWEDRAFT_29358 [Aspergillus wentii DTO 134E9]KAI9927968.1 hypothetical protein MW887_002820 [Aspergillus wentii]OJJ34195.1 hypothetical protein ASPWEDRAFT_29358 [Aspergillus wentii DTO 134E9]
MAQVPTPPASRHGSESPDVEQKKPVVDSSAELLQSLDTLLERYLCLLDRHQKLQADLGKRLSSGFFSLAHANYTCPPGRRYGADYYDERMKATRKMSLQSTPSQDKDECIAKKNDDSAEQDQSDNYKHTFAIQAVPDSRPSEQTEPDKEAEQDQSNTDPQEGEKHSSKENSSTENQKTDSLNSPEPSKADSTEPAKPKASKKKFQSSNPITWYGILVPPSLRSAQMSFTEAVEGQLPELASVVVEMQAVEKEVERVRSELGQA